jgi:hypothetical protein
MSKVGYQTRIRARIVELQNLIKAAKAELDELEVAERVLERLSDGTHVSTSGHAGAPDVALVKLSGTKSGNTVADRALSALCELGPMTSADLLLHLQETWRHDLAQTTLSSTLSRVTKTGKVINQNGVWSVNAIDAQNVDQGTLGDDLDQLGNSATDVGGQNVKPVADVFE